MQLLWWCVCLPLVSADWLARVRDGLVYQFSFQEGLTNPNATVAYDDFNTDANAVLDLQRASFLTTRPGIRIHPYSANKPASGFASRFTLESLIGQMDQLNVSYKIGRAHV